jgi:hypothetical protein
MPEYVIMSYNIEHMNKMFENNIIKDSEKARAEDIAKVIQGVYPHVLGICEAANSEAEHNYFINNYLAGSGYKLANGTSRGGQNLVFYYRDPFTIESVDDAISFYEPWSEDIEEDGIKERFEWDRKPLEAVFKIGQNGPKLRIILVHTKSKGVFSVVDFANFQKVSLANRKRLVAQALKLRQRIEQLINDPNSLPLIVMGDMNDGPGLDPFEALIGSSFVETVMGSIFDPDKIFHNVLWHFTKTSETRKNLWTAQFPDPIVNNPLGYEHRVWIDHIIVSRDMTKPDNAIRYITDSGQIEERNTASYKASDHFAVYCKIEKD